MPQLEPEWPRWPDRYLGHEMLVVGPGIKTGMAIRFDNPRELGADRLVNAVAAYERFGGAVHRRRLRHRDHLRRRLAPTASTSAASSRPGVEISLEALYRARRELPQIDLAQPRR